MSEYDLVIRGGTIVDGTGVPRYRADLAVKNGRVAKSAAGSVPEAPKRSMPGTALWRPGAIDMHTHYDAQLNWTPMLRCRAGSG